MTDVTKLIEAPVGTGWPWTAPSPPIMAHTGDGLPRISVVTINFNHGDLLEQTIRSVVLQNYPALEYIVIDGGSSDSSRDVVERYRPWISYFVSEPDRGPAHATNKAFDRVTGALVGWISSTDYLMPGTLMAVARAWQRHGPAVYYGRCAAISSDGTRVRDDIFGAPPPRATSWVDNLLGCVFPLPGIFVPGRAVEEGLRCDERLLIANDWAFVLQVMKAYPARYLDTYVAAYRLHAERLSGDGLRTLDERLQVLSALFWTRLAPLERLQVMSAIGALLTRRGLNARGAGRRFEGWTLQAVGSALDWRRWRGVRVGRA